MLTDSLTPGGGPPDPSRRSSSDSVQVEEAAERDRRIRLWNDGVAPCYLESARVLSVAPRLVAAMPTLPSRVGALLAHGGALGSAKFFLDLLHLNRMSKECQPIASELLSAHATTAASFTAYIAKQGYSSQIGKPIELVTSTLAHFSGSQRTRLLERCVEALSALKTSARVKDHPGITFVNELRSTLSPSEEGHVLAGREELLVRAYARMRHPQGALDVCKRAAREGRELSLEVLGEVLESASAGVRDDFVLVEVENLAAKRLKQSSISSVCGWGEVCLSIGRMDLAEISAARALGMALVSGTGERLRAEALAMAVRVLKWEVGGARTWPEDFSASPAERTQVLARSAQLILPMKREHESESIVGALVEQVLTASSGDDRTLTAEAESVVCRLIAWSMLNQFTKVGHRLLAALPPTLSEQASASSDQSLSYLTRGWLRATAESFRSPREAPGTRQLFYKTNGRVEQAFLEGRISVPEMRRLYRLGSQLSACCGELEVITSMLHSAEILKTSAEAGPLVGDASDLMPPNLEFVAEGVLQLTEVGISGYQFARFLNNKVAEVMPSYLDLRVLEPTSGISFN